MLETHPFGSFCPPKARYLILGSFTTKEAFDATKKKDYIWFYANGGRNHFWPILAAIYKTPLKTRSDMQRLLTSQQIALADIIYQCERKKVSNLDIHLTNIVFATKDITNLLASNKIEKIFFTSRFVEHKFKTNFKKLIVNYPEIELITLPSPSPRYVQMTKLQKLAKYRALLPKPKN